jgi:hypothetical protein
VKIATTLILIGLVTSPAYSQGLHLVQRETRNGQVTTNNILLDRTHMRAESRSGNEQVAFVYDGSAQVARMINLDKKTYFEMTRAQAQQMGQQADSAMAAMQEQLKNMPPEQRQMVEQMMRARGLGAGPTRGGGPPASERIEYRRTGTDKVAQFPCTKYEGYRGQAKVVEVCAAEPRDLGVTAADFEVTRQFAEFIKIMLPQAADQIATYGSVEEQGFAGFPVRRTSFRNGAVESVSELAELRRETIPPATFDVPAGFRQEAMPGAR